MVSEELDFVSWPIEEVAPALASLIGSGSLAVAALFAKRLLSLLVPIAVPLLPPPFQSSRLLRNQLWSTSQCASEGPIYSHGPKADITDFFETQAHTHSCTLLLLSIPAVRHIPQISTLRRDVNLFSLTAKSNSPMVGQVLISKLYRRLNLSKAHHVRALADPQCSKHKDRTPENTVQLK